MTARPTRTSSQSIDLDAAIERLRTSGGRVTESRRSLLSHLQAATSRLTADQLTEAFPETDPATIYRSLAHFEDAGIVEHIHVGHGPSAYRWVGHDDVTIFCDTCGETVDAPVELFRDLDDRLADRFGYRLALGHFALTGRCNVCDARP